jgi:hypothetical protein
VGDVTLTVGAAAIELGVPLVLVVLFWRRPQSRRKLAVVLGGVTLPLVVYGCIAIGLPIDPTDPGNRWASRAMWVMSFLPYLALLAVAFGMSFMPRPSNLAARYLIGLVAGPIGFILLLLGSVILSAA